MKPHTILYARKSSEEDDRQILSLDAQETECRSYAARHGTAITAVVREAHSARKPGRPLFQGMLRDCEDLLGSGRPVTVLCHKPDRLLRNLADWARLNDLMDKGLDLAFVTGSYPNNAQGKMAFGVNVLFAKYYVDNLSEEVRKGMREKLARGEWPGAAPLGYRNLDKRIAIDPATAPLIVRAFERFSTGEWSLHRLADQLFLEGLTGRRLKRKLTKNVLRTHVLGNPFYCGLMRYGGELYPGIHEKLITAALFDRVQEALAGRTRPKRYRHDFRFSGVFTCRACGGLRVGDLKKGRYVYYRCSARRGCTEPALREETLAALLRERFSSDINLVPEIQLALRQGAQELAAAEDERGGASMTSLGRQHTLVKQKLDALLDLRLLGQVSAEEFQEKRAELLLEEARAREQIQTFELKHADPQEAIERFIATCNELGSLLLTATPQEVRALLRLVGSNYCIAGRSVDFEPVEPFSMATQARNRPVWSPGPDDVHTLLLELGSAEGLLPS